MTPGSLGFLRHQIATLNTPVSEDVEQADRDEELPRQGLQLVLTEARVREPHPEHEERHRHDLGEEHERAEEPHHAERDAPRRGQRPAAEVERGGDGGERERGAELADEEEEEAEAGVLDHVAGDELALGDGHVERRLRELGLRRDEEQHEADELREDEREADAVQPKIEPVLWKATMPCRLIVPGLDDHADDREQQRQLVGDELRGGAQRAEQRELVGARPARP